MMPTADRIESAFNRIGHDEPNVGTQVQTAQSALFGLTSPAAIDLRIWTSTVADQLNGTNPYHAGGLEADLMRARKELDNVRRYCAAS